MYSPLEIHNSLTPPIKFPLNVQVQFKNQMSASPLNFCVIKWEIISTALQQWDLFLKSPLTCYLHFPGIIVRFCVPYFFCVWVLWSLGPYILHLGTYQSTKNVCGKQSVLKIKLSFLPPINWLWSFFSKQIGIMHRQGEVLPLLVVLGPESPKPEDYIARPDAWNSTLWEIDTYCSRFSKPETYNSRHSGLSRPGTCQIL